MVTVTDILDRLPYSAPFRFVDALLHVDENGVEGTFFLDPELDFYRGHFAGNPVTPGVILTEIMAQIGVVCLGIFLMDGETANIAMTSSEIEFLHPVFPGEIIRVSSEKQYFRFGKLKCKVSLFNADGNLACCGSIAGMII